MIKNTNKKNKKNKRNKRNTLKKKKNKGKGKNDPYSLKGKKVCDDNVELYFGDVFSSSNYYVYSLCKDKTLKICNESLAKIYQITKYKKIISVIEEAQYMIKGFLLGVSPEFLGVYICEYQNKQYAIVIVKYYGEGDLTKLIRDDYYDEHKELIDEKLKYILDTLYDNNINHNDLHSDNFLYRFNENGEIEFKIIDFDAAKHFLLDDKKNYIIENLHDGSYININ